TTIVDTAAITTPRRERRRWAAARTARRSSDATAVTELLQDRRAGRRAEPALLERLQGPRLLEVGDRLADALRQRRALLQERAPRVAAGRAELADDLRLGHLHGGEEERGREVDDDRVDLLLLERRHHVVGVVEHLRLARRLDDLVHRVEARRPD